MKVKKWILLRAGDRLRRKDTRILEQLAEANEPLYHAYLLKERLRAILRYPWKYLGALRHRMEEWIDTARLAELPEVARVAERLAPHVEAVVAGHRHHLRLGLVEAINSKIAVLRAQARGYRDPEYFKLKIFQRCGMPENPWARIVL